MPITLDGTNGITTPTYGGADTSEYLVPVTQFKNRIINGAMVIDQRNAGASVGRTGITNSYTLDRWNTRADNDGVFSVQRITDSPAGFTNSLIVTVTTADSSIGAAQVFGVNQSIEGFNVADLGFGTANAKTVTVSFWVKSSLTGSFGGSLSNGASNRSYPFLYTISSANTWEYKSITIAGDTTGTWATDNTEGLRLNFAIGTGSNELGTANAWASGLFRGTTGQTQVISTLNATWQITGVQLEVGSTATSFDYRPYGTELALCQRYYYKNLNSSGGARNMFTLQAYSTSACFGKMFDFPVQMRGTPSINSSGTFTGSTASAGSAGSGTFTDVRATTNFVEANAFTGLSGLTAGHASVVVASNNAFIELSSEL